MPQTIIAANWKMHGSQGMTAELLEGVKNAAVDAGGREAKTIFCPPYPYIAQVYATVRDWPFIGLGAQDCHIEDRGAFTGDVSAGMLKDLGCGYVILGHSERRKHYHETDGIIKGKVEAALRNGLLPILCVGETLAEREEGKAQSVVENQLLGGLPDAGLPNPLIVAYEPVWAIGTGKTPSLEDIDEMHHFIAKVLETKKSIERNRLAVLYGGSVKAAKAAELFSLESVNGVLVGGASLEAAEFSAIIKAAAER